MNITYAIDKNVYKLALVSFASLLKNNMQEDIDLYILCKKNENYLELKDSLENTTDTFIYLGSVLHLLM